jgi:plasmid stability protein
MGCHAPDFDLAHGVLGHEIEVAVAVEVIEAQAVGARGQAKAGVVEAAVAPHDGVAVGAQVFGPGEIQRARRRTDNLGRGLAGADAAEVVEQRVARFARPAAPGGAAVSCWRRPRQATTAALTPSARDSILLSNQQQKRRRIVAAVVVRDLPLALHQRLKQQAEYHHRSMNREVIAILERELQAPMRVALPPPVQPLVPVDGREIVDFIRKARDSRP